jgi:hypothetical protein
MHSCVGWKEVMDQLGQMDPLVAFLFDCML